MALTSPSRSLTSPMHGPARRNLILKNFRAASGFSMDLLLHSPGAVLVNANVSRWLAACVPNTPAEISRLLAMPRADRYPGKQEVALVEAAGRSCIRGSCFDRYTQFVDHSAKDPTTATEGRDEVGC